MIFCCKRTATSCICSNSVAWNLHPISWCWALKLLSGPLWDALASSSSPDLVGAADHAHLCCHWWARGKGRAEKALLSTRYCISETEKPWQVLPEVSCLRVGWSWVKVDGQVKKKKTIKQRLIALSNVECRGLAREEKCAGAAPQRTDPVLRVMHRQTLQILSSVLTWSLLAKRLFLCWPECDLG